MVHRQSLYKSYCNIKIGIEIVPKYDCIGNFLVTAEPFLLSRVVGIVKFDFTCSRYFVYTYVFYIK